MKSERIGERLSGWSGVQSAQCSVRFVDRWDACEIRGLVAEPRIARGNGRSYGDASFASNGTTLLIAPRNHFLEFDSQRGMLRAEAGVTVGEVLDVIEPLGWFLPITPGTKFATLGGSVAADVHGRNHVQEGTFARSIERMTIRLADDSEAICSANENPDLFHATCGGLGLTGIVKEVTVNLQRIETGWFEVRYSSCPDIPTLLRTMREPSSGQPYVVAWIDGLSRGSSLHRAIVVTASHATNAAAEGEELPRRPAQWKRSWSLPFDAPDFLLNRPLMRLHNAWYNARFENLADAQYEWYTDFLYPLDRVANWNRLYGRRGFLQYQFAVPHETAQLAISETFALLDNRQQPIFLAVIKPLGEEAGPLSFPRRGVTLAVDLPMTGRPLLEALDALDERIVAHGGRVYLAKDSRMNAKWVGLMYPRLEEWRRVKREVDPENAFQSDLSRRLRLLE